MKATIKALIQNHSFNEVSAKYHAGQVGQSVYEAYCRVWEWVTPRFGGQVGLKHDWFWKANGKDRYYAKINRVRLAFGFEAIPA